MGKQQQQHRRHHQVQRVGWIPYPPFGTGRFHGSRFHHHPHHHQHQQQQQQQEILKFSKPEFVRAEGCSIIGDGLLCNVNRCKCFGNDLTVIGNGNRICGERCYVQGQDNVVLTPAELDQAGGYWPSPPLRATPPPSTVSFNQVWGFVLNQLAADEKKSEQSQQQQHQQPVPQEEQEQEQQPTQTAGKCVICTISAADVLALPCRHLCLCKRCNSSPEALRVTRCPICRSKIGQWLPIFVV